MIHIRDSRRVFGECSRVVFKRNRKACRGPRCYMVYIPYKPSHDPASSACQAHFGDARLWRRTVDLVKQCHKFNMLGILTPGGPRRFLRGFFFPIPCVSALSRRRGLSPRPANQGLGGPSSRVSPCFALLCSALLPCLALLDFALLLFGSLILWFFCSFAFCVLFFLLAGLACLLACLFPCLLACWLAGLLIVCLLGNCHQHSLLIGSHLQRLAANRVAASGRQCPQHSLLSGSHLQPLAANRVAASGRQWPPAFGFSSAATCSHLQPLEWPPVAASGRQWPPAFSFHRQPLAATCSQSSGRKWPQVAASGARASGRKWLQVPQVAASGRKWPQVAAFAKIKFVPFCTLSETTCCSNAGCSFRPTRTLSMTAFRH